MGRGYPKIVVDTLREGETIEELFEALRSAAIAYGYSEQTFDTYLMHRGMDLTEAHGGKPE